jgi:hypothetical protein
MSDFSPSEAALEGLRITRERPVAVLWWWLAYVAVAVVQFAVSLLPPFKALQAAAPEINAHFAALQQNPNDSLAEQQLMTALGHAAPSFTLFALLVLVLQVVLWTAVLRAVLRPADRALGYLRLSMDELRQLGLAAICILAFFVYLFVVLLGASLILSLIVGLLGGGGGGGAAAALAPLVAGLILVALIYPAVRLSLAPAMTLADGRISFRRAWALTQGRFWSLFGAYALAVVFGLIVLLGFMAILFVVVTLTAHGVAPEPHTLPELMTPAALTLLVLEGLFGALVGAIHVAPLASAFRQLTGRVGAPVQAKSSSGSPWGQA